MKLKYYAEVDNIDSAIDYFSKIFDIQIVKNNHDSNHAYIKLFGVISLLLRSTNENKEKVGYYIIRFADGELHEYKKAVEKVRNSNLTRILFNEIPGKWGTTFFEFQDKYGYIWDFEIKSDLLV